MESRKWELEHPEQVQETHLSASRRYRETHKEQIRELQQKRVKAHQEFVRGLLRGKVCAKCHKESNTRKLVFHHIDPGTKKFRVCECNHSEAAILAEIAKCVIWCRSCHGKFHNTLHQKG